MPMEDTYGIQSRIGSIIVVERWYCCRGSPVFSDRNIHSFNANFAKKLNIPGSVTPVSGVLETAILEVRKP